MLPRAGNPPLNSSGSLAFIEIGQGRAQLVSRKGRKSPSFTDLANAIRDTRTVLDGEIVSIRPISPAVALGFQEV